MKLDHAMIGVHLDKTGDLSKTVYFKISIWRSGSEKNGDQCVLGEQDRVFRRPGRRGDGGEFPHVPNLASFAFFDLQSDLFGCRASSDGRIYVVDLQYYRGSHKPDLQ